MQNYLSPGLAISALVWLDFSFHLLALVIYLSWLHLCPTFAHVQTISTSYGLRNYAIGYTCTSLEMSTFVSCSNLVFSCVQFPVLFLFWMPDILLRTPCQSCMRFLATVLVCSCRTSPQLFPSTFTTCHFYSVMCIFLCTSVGMKQWVDFIIPSTFRWMWILYDHW